jgi:serine/threonine protein kinase
LSTEILRFVVKVLYSTLVVSCCNPRVRDPWNNSDIVRTLTSGPPPPSRLLLPIRQSANVLLDDHWVVKVADLGSSRQLRPRPPQMVYASYTGVRKVVTGRGTAPIYDLAGDCSRGAEVKSMTVGDADPTGAMTRAVGTLLWMPPEMYDPLSLSPTCPHAR